MKSFFDQSVDGVLELYNGQLQQIEKRGTRLRVSQWIPSRSTRSLTQTKNVLLIGGFGESPYLHEAFQKFLRYRNVELRRPDTSQVTPQIIGI